MIKYSLILSATLLTSTAYAQSITAEPLLEKALKIADSTEQQVIEWRRHIHMNPELSWQESETAKYISQVLATLPGFEVQVGIAKTGIKAILRGSKPGPTIAFRADMDALPVEERNNLPYKSTKKAFHQGKEVHVSHVCGHDTHVAMLLGAAKVFSDMRSELPGNIVLLFQPAEEGGPGNSGAVKMLEAGVLDNPKVDVVMGQHISPGLPAGSISYRFGTIHSSADNFNIKLIGKGGHGSSPWAANSPLLAATEIVQSLQGIISHRVNQLDGPIVLTVGMLQSGNRTNILPETAEIGGSIRALSKSNQQIAREALVRRTKKIAESQDLIAEVSVNSGGYEMIISDPTITRSLVSAFDLAASVKGGAHEMLQPSMASDDFSSFGSTGIPTVFWRLQASPFADKPGAPNHSPDFQIDESAMRVGVRALVAAGTQYMTATTILKK